MGFAEAWMLSVGIGFGLYFGLKALGQEIRTGMVEAAKVTKGVDVQPRKVDG